MIVSPWADLGMFAKCHKYINKYSRLYGRWGVPHCQFCCRRFLALYLAPFLPRTCRLKLRGALLERSWGCSGAIMDSYRAPAKNGR